MKQLKIIFLLLLSIISIPLYAYDIEVGGVYYNINTTAKTAEVTYKTIIGGDYSGYVIIPSSIKVGVYNCSVISIGKKAFYDCNGLTGITIPNSVTSIGAEAFSGCKGLTSITLPNSITSIRKEAFYGCSGLVSLSIPNSVTSIGDGAFLGCKGLTSFSLPNRITFISDRVFYECEGLTSITIPNSVTSIGDDAFAYCECLTSMTIPNSVTSIGKGAFRGCNGLISITIPDNVTYIGSQAFFGCSGLTSVTIPNSVTSIGDGAFAYCSKLYNVYSYIETPFEITSVFEYIPRREAILHVPKGSKSLYQALSCWSFNFNEIVEIDVIQHSLSIQSSDYGSVIYNGVAIRNKTISFTIDDGDSATLTFTPDNGYQLASVKVGSTDVTSSVSNNQYTISNISANTTVTVIFEASQSYTYDVEVDGIYYKLNQADKTAEVTYNKTGGSYYSGSITIPSSIEYQNTKYRVVSIGNSAFSDSGLKSISLPNSIKNIDDYSFAWCKNLISISIPESVKSIGECAFYECENLSSLTLHEGITSIGQSAFSNCAINNLYLPSTLEVIDEHAFMNCKIPQIIIPSSVRSIGTYAFGGCKEMVSMVVESTNSYYDSRDNCNAIINTSANQLIAGCKETIIPNSVSSIGKWAFRNNGLLTSIVLPSSVKSIGELAFGECPNLTSVISEIQTPYNIYNDVFYNISSEAVLYVPKGTKSKYQAFSGWTSNFKDIVEISAQYSLSITSSGNGTVSYNGTTVRNKTTSFTVEEGSSATLTFSPDDGYQLASVKVGSTDVTSSVSNNKYTISNITADKTVTVTFEAIPVTTYTLKITASGNGSVTYDGTAVKNKTTSFSVEKGSSATLTFTPDNGYQLSSVKVGSTDVTSSVSNNKYTISNITADKTITVSFEAIPVTTYTLSITASGNGSVTYDGTAIKNKTTSFTVEKGASATLTFTPDNGYQLGSVKVGSTDVTSSVSNNKYTISNITSDKTITVSFEAIPVTTYTLKVTASGNGSVSYNGTTVKNKTTSFTVDKGTSATLTFTPDNGYQLGSVKVGSTDVTSSVSNNKYTISNITADKTVTVTFEAIPVTTYTLSITASGNGSVTYDGTAVKNKTTSFTVEEGSSATLTFTPDNGYQLASVKVGSTDVTSSVSNNKYTISNITANKTVTVIFEEIPVTTYTLSITASGNGSVTYDGTAVKNKTTSFTVEEGLSATLTFTPDNGYQLASVKVGSTDVTSSVSNNKYTISNITANTTVTVTFEATQSYSYDVEVDGIYYNLNTNNKTAEVTNKTDNGGDYSGSVTISSSINVNGIQYSVTSIGNASFGNCWELTSITIPNSITSIGNAAFRCSGLTSITIPNSVTSIGAMAFFSCSNLTSITLPNSVTTLDNHVFNHCSSLTSITIPNSVTSIGNWTFSDCSGLKSINIPNSIVSIGEGAFNGCSSLTSITIPNSVTSIGENAFWFCSSLSEVISNIETPFKIPDGVFGCISDNAILYVPQGTKSKYQAFSGWTNHFKDIVESGVTQYSLSISVSGNGSVTYNGTSIRNSTSSFTVDEGTSATLTFIPDNGYQLTSVKVDGWELSNVKWINQYTISNMSDNTSIVVTFEESPKEVTFEGVNYTVASYQEKTVTVAKGTYGQVLAVPATFNIEGETWTVTGIDANALSDNKDLAAIIWNPKTPFTGQVSNPNLLLYVTSVDYAPSTIKNVVINNKAASITLTDAAEGNDFYCPQEFTAQRITYSHYYGMTTGFHESRGWETIALPFDVDKITHSTKGTLVPFASWNNGGSAKPFWLYEYGAGGFKEATAIRANTPYIISMPNNDQYLADYRVNGTVTFSAENAVVKKSENMQTVTNGSYTFVPNFAKQDASTVLYVLNVNNNYATNTTASTEGSVFIRNNRAVHPFEAYMTTSSANAKPFFAVFEDVPTGIYDATHLIDNGELIIDNVGDWYSVSGQKLSGKPAKKGIYIHNGKTVVY